MSYLYQIDRKIFSQKFDNFDKSYSFYYKKKIKNKKISYIKWLFFTYIRNNKKINL